jgi:hypothetical protein
LVIPLCSAQIAGGRPLQLRQQREQPGTRRLRERVVGIDAGGQIDHRPEFTQSGYAN